MNLQGSEVPDSNSRESSLLHMEMMTLAIVLGTVSYDLKTRRHWLDLVGAGGLDTPWIELTRAINAWDRFDLSVFLTQLRFVVLEIGREW